MIGFILALLTGVLITGILISILTFLRILENKGGWIDEVYFTAENTKE